MWVAQHAAKRVERKRMGDASDGESVYSILAWVDEGETEVSLTCSVDDILTPDLQCLTIPT